MSSGVLKNSSQIMRWNRISEIFRSLIATALCAGMAFGQSINMSNWGTVTTPVYNQAESNPFYSNAEILAGPNRFGSYYAGVLPNGKKVTPAGLSIQIGMNPLGVAVTPDGQFAVTSNDDERDGTLPRSVGLSRLSTQPDGPQPARQRFSGNGAACGATESTLVRCEGKNGNLHVLYRNSELYFPAHLSVTKYL